VPPTTGDPAADAVDPAAVEPTQRETPIHAADPTVPRQDEAHRTAAESTRREASGHAAEPTAADVRRAEVADDAVTKGGAAHGMRAVAAADPAAEDPADAPDRIVTIPNALSILRLLGVPLFLYLLLGPHADGWALTVLALSAFTDWADGKLARLLNQTSRVGILLDPAADRLYILATLIAFVVRDIVPLWLALVIIGRDVLLACTLPILRRHGYGPPPVHHLGKAATFALLYAFPLLLLAEGHGVPSDLARPSGWAFTIWGSALYLWAGALYVLQVIQLVRADRSTAARNATSTATPGATAP
jgi:cardiolipin synthase (CMP-forming)